MPSDPALHIKESYRLIQQSKLFAQAGREQVAKSKTLIAESRRIIDALRSDPRYSLLQNSASEYHRSESLFAKPGR